MFLIIVTIYHPLLASEEGCHFSDGVVGKVELTKFFIILNTKAHHPSVPSSGRRGRFLFYFLFINPGGVMRTFNRKYLKQKRKDLRNKPTPAEAFLWSYLKGSKFEGRKFRRQTSIKLFIVDLYCPEENLVI